MSSIIEMPDLVLEHIIGFLDFRTVFTFRQVCKDFRNFIDDLKKSKLPDSKFKSINVFLENEERIRLAFMWDYNSQIEIGRCFAKWSPSFFESISQGMGFKCFGDKKIHSEQEDLEMDRVLEYFVVNFSHCLGTMTT